VFCQDVFTPLIQGDDAFNVPPPLFFILWTCSVEIGAVLCLGLFWVAASSFFLKGPYSPLADGAYLPSFLASRILSPRLDYTQNSPGRLANRP